MVIRPIDTMWHAMKLSVGIKEWPFAMEMCHALFKYG